MKICKKCEKPFKTSAYIDGKRQTFHHRSYCLECSPFGVKHGYKLRREKTRKLIQNGRPCKTCPICQKVSSWTKSDVCSTCRSSNQRWKKRQKALDKLGGKCCHCGTEDREVLTFHHRDKTEKKFTLSGWWQSDWNVLEEEIDKCDLLCFNCHIKFHVSENRDKVKMINDYFESKENEMESDLQ